MRFPQQTTKPLVGAPEGATKTVPPQVFQRFGRAFRRSYDVDDQNPSYDGSYIATYPQTIAFDVKRYETIDKRLS